MVFASAGPVKLSSRLTGTAAGYWGLSGDPLGGLFRPPEALPAGVAGSNTGWIIQHLTATFAVTDAHDNAVRIRADNGHWDYLRHGRSHLARITLILYPEGQ